MAVKFTSRTSALTALAVGIAALSLPATASAQEREHRGGWQGRDGNAGNADSSQPQGRRNPAPAAAARASVPAPVPAPAPPASPFGRYQRHGSTGATANPAPVPAPQAGWQARGNPSGARSGWPSGARSGYPNGVSSGWQGNRDAARPNPNRTGNGQWQGSDRNRSTAARTGQWNNNTGQRSNGWRNDNRYDWRGWRNQNRDAFRVGRYRAPFSDYFYRRLGIGFYLEPMFFGYDYLINDPWAYRLPPAYGPYQWVRYYNDVLLVDTENGEVVDAIYDFFW